MSSLADRFMQALQQLERERDVSAITSLFAEEATLRRAPREHLYRGSSAVREFWQEYLDAFEHIETCFGDVTEGAERIVLEWHSVATGKRGQRVEYDGCSVLQGEGDRVCHFRTYYDAGSAGMNSAAVEATTRR